MKKKTLSQVAIEYVLDNIEDTGGVVAYGRIHDLDRIYELWQAQHNKTKNPWPSQKWNAVLNALAKDTVNWEMSWFMASRGLARKFKLKRIS